MIRGRACVVQKGQCLVQCQNREEGLTGVAGDMVHSSDKISFLGVRCSEVQWMPRKETGACGARPAMKSLMACGWHGQDPVESRIRTFP